MINGAPIAIITFQPGTPVQLAIRRTEPFPLCTPERLINIRSEVDAILERFRGYLDGVMPSLPSLNRAAKWLDEKMGDIALALVDQDVHRLGELTRRMRAAWPTWARPGEQAVPTVEVRGYEHDFPFELLPVFDQTPVQPFGNLLDAERTFRRFLGFGLSVRRVVGERVPTEDLTADPRLRLQYFRYEMAGARSELQSLRAIADLQVDGPWPPAGLPAADAREHLIDLLYDPSRSMNGAGGPRTFGAQVQHFACHADTDGPGDGAYSLRLGSVQAALDVTLTQIRRGFRTRMARGLDRPAAGPPVRPLVMVNACGSAKVDSATRESFPRWFLGNQHRGFIGSEVQVPDLVAAEFSARFYRAFVVERRPLGEAVVLARLRLLAEHNNPLGLLYVQYGNPLLTVTPR